MKQIGLPHHAKVEDAKAKADDTKEIPVKDVAKQIWINAC